MSARRIISEEILNRCTHSVAIRDAEVVLSGAKHVFGITPGRAHQRRSARKCFEDADCGYPAQAVRILTSRNVKCKSTAAVSCRSLEVGQVSAIFDSTLAQSLQCTFGITNSIRDHSPSLQCACWLEQKLRQFSRTLIVAPVSNPQDIGFLFGRQGRKDIGIGSLVKSPHVRHAKAFRINPPDRLTERY